MSYDTIIIGAGPAGLTAAIYAVRRKMNALVIAKEIGGQILWASEIENYPGFDTISGYDLIQKIKTQADELGVAVQNDEIKEVQKNETGFTVITNKNSYSAKSLIIAIGLVPRRLAIPGENELTGRGISYCANCDAPLYKNKIVAVVGGGNSALDAAEVLSKIGSKVVLVHRRNEFRADEALVERVKSRNNVEFYTNCEIKEIRGQKKVENLIIINKNKKSETEIKVDGLFIEIGRIAHTDIFAGLAKRDVFDQIIVDGKCQTSTPGIFAAGDVTNSQYKQITVACGQGTIAALAAYEYLQKLDGKSAMPVLDRGKK